MSDAAELIVRAQADEIEQWRTEAQINRERAECAEAKNAAQAQEIERLKDWSKHSPGNATASLIVEMTQRAEAAEARVREEQEIAAVNLAAIEAKTIERCAKIADEMFNLSGGSVAAAIRALRHINSAG